MLKHYGVYIYPFIYSFTYIEGACYVASTVLDAVHGMVGKFRITVSRTFPLEPLKCPYPQRVKVIKNNHK